MTTNTPAVSSIIAASTVNFRVIFLTSLLQPCRSRHASVARLFRVLRPCMRASPNRPPRTVGLDPCGERNRRHLGWLQEICPPAHRGRTVHPDSARMWSHFEKPGCRFNCTDPNPTTKLTCGSGGDSRAQVSRSPRPHRPTVSTWNRPMGCRLSRLMEGCFAAAGHLTITARRRFE